MKRSSTKGALFTSALALLLCFVMLLGTTFAWFTDEVTSANNKIQAGTLEIDLLYKDVDATDYISVKELIKDGKDTAIFNYTNWEPGYVEAKHVKVETDGSLALKYTLKIVPIGDVEALADVIDVYYASSEVALPDRSLTGLTRVGTLRQVIDGMNGLVINDQLVPKEASDKFGGNVNTEDFATIALKMVESAGNEYQGTKIGTTFDINLYATQYTYESDSFDNMYDDGLDAATSYVATEAELAEALAEGGKIELMGDIALENTLTIAEGKEVVLDMGDYKLGSENTVITNNGTLKIVGGTIETTKVNGTATISNNGTLVLDGAEVIGAPIGATGYPVYAVTNSGKLTVEDGTVITAQRGAVSMSAGSEVVINGGTFTVSDAADGRNMTLHTIYAYGSGSKLTINDGYFEMGHTSTGGASVICPAGAAIDIYGGDFRDAMDDNVWTSTGNFQNYMGYSAPVNVYGGTFDDATVNKHLAPGYETQSLGGSAVVVLPAGDNTVAGADNSTTLNTVLAGGATTVYLGSGNYIIPDSAQGKTLTFVGDGDTVIATQDDGSYEGCDYSLDGATVTFEGITITTDSTTYTGYARLKATYNNCTINGTYTLYDDSEFNNCTFNVEGDVYNIWTWGATTATFNDCVFENDGKAVLLYGTANTTLTMNDCVFNDNGGLTDLKAAIEIGNDYGKSYNLIVNNATVNGYEINDKGINTGSTLWANKNSMGQDKLNVVIDGVDVY